MLTHAGFALSRLFVNNTVPPNMLSCLDTYYPRRNDPETQGS